MKKNKSNKQPDEMREEYDFSGGERGKHFKEYRNGHSVRIDKADASFAEVDPANKKESHKRMTLDEIRQLVTPACREFDVQRLDAFGSTVRGDARTSSDVDLLVEFKDPDRSAAKRFFGLLHRLEDDLGCDVDLLTTSGLRNPYFRRSVMRERVPLYEG